MAVPAHDDRDHEFATRYGLPIRQVIAPATGESVDVQAQAWVNKEGTVTINSGEFSGLDYQAFFDRVVDLAEQRGIGRRQINYRLRDWGVSRQRYWGCPVPVIHCSACGAVPVPDDQLPVLLPEDVTFMGVQSPLKSLPEWCSAECPKCGAIGERETDTFDTFVESSWYYARYCTPGAESMLDERANYWLPVDHYIGGIEHAVLHLLYFRFWHKLMRDVGLVACNEPTANLLCQGMVLAKAYYRDTEEEGRIWIRPDEVEFQQDPNGQEPMPVWRADGKAVEATGWTTMSKSKNNGADPQDLIDRYGADTVRLFAMFASPPDQALEWNDDAVAGSQRFLRRLWVLVHRHQSMPTTPATDFSTADDETKALRHQLHTILQRIQRDMERHQYNTVVAACMELVNALDRFDVAESPQRQAALREALDVLVRVLAPVTPHICHALWEVLAMDGELLDATWPVVDPLALKREQVQLVVQINGKLRAEIEVAADAKDKEIQVIALADPRVSRHIGNAAVRKFVIVPGRLVNIVV